MSLYLGIVQRITPEVPESLDPHRAHEEDPGFGRTVKKTRVVAKEE